MEKNKTNKIAIYCRVSMDKQTTENQKIRLTEFAKSRGWEFDVFEEVQSTRKTRPVKYSLYNKLLNREYSGVLVYKLDRWGRSSQELIKEIFELHKREINFISYSDNIDLSTSAGKLQLKILSAFAEFERDLIRDRTIEGIKRAKQKGKTLGRPKGSKDQKQRRKAGYFFREAKKRQREDEEQGIFKPIDYYINNPPPKNRGGKNQKV